MSRRKSTEPEVRFTVRLRGAPVQWLEQLRVRGAQDGKLAQISDVVRDALERATLAQDDSK